MLTNTEPIKSEYFIRSRSTHRHFTSSICDSCQSRTTEEDRLHPKTERDQLDHSICIPERPPHYQAEGRDGKSDSSACSTCLRICQETEAHTINTARHSNTDQGSQTPATIPATGKRLSLKTLSQIEIFSIRLPCGGGRRGYKLQICKCSTSGPYGYCSQFTKRLNLLQIELFNQSIDSYSFPNSPNTGYTEEDCIQASMATSNPFSYRNIHYMCK